MLRAPPRIALATRGRVSPYDYGAIWHVLDKQIGIRHSHLEEDDLGETDLRRYNVVVLPDRWFGDISDSTLSSLKAWVEAGGTLIAVGDSAGALAKEKPGLSRVRQLGDVLGKLDEYRLRLQRELMASESQHPSMDLIWSHSTETGLNFPWDSGGDSSFPNEEEMKKRDAWQKIFMPQGALLAGRVDSEHWLAFGAEKYLPVLYGNYPVLMAGDGVDVPIRMGYYITESEPDEDASKDAAQVGWASVPAGQTIMMRMSGLLWPEAAHRIANSAWVTREAKGRGQVILFATPPAFRGATKATIRVLMNALVYGPGLGARHPVTP